MSKRISLLIEPQREKIDNFVVRCIKENIFNNEVEALRVITPFYCNETLIEQHFELPKEQLLEIFGDSIEKTREEMKSEEHFNFDKRKEIVVEEKVEEVKPEIKEEINPEVKVVEPVKMGGLF